MKFTSHRERESYFYMNKFWIIGGLLVGALVGIPLITRASNASSNIFIRSGIAGVPELIRGNIQIPISIEVANFSGISANVTNMFAAIYYKNSKGVRTLAARSTERSNLNLSDGKTLRQTMQFQIDPLDMADIVASNVQQFEVEVTYDFANLQRKTSVPVDISGIIARIKNFLPFKLFGTSLS